MLYLKCNAVTLHQISEQSHFRGCFSMPKRSEMIECQALDCINNIGSICGHADPEITIKPDGTGRCLSYEKDWRWCFEAQGV